MSNGMRWIGFALLLVMGIAHAQNCPEGMAPEGGQGVASCVPVDNGNQSRGHWVNRWGAIATDAANQGVGASFNQPSEEDAKQSALANCLSNGGSHCKVEKTYFNSCIAMVVGDKGYNIDVAETVDQAIQDGTKRCVGAGDTNCRARYRSCSTAQWVQ